MLVELLNLHKTFGQKDALHGVSFSFSSGEVVGFVGPNGAGKTTTMRIMSTLMEPTDGDVLYDGRSVVNFPEEIRSLIGFMPDSLPELKDMTVLEYLDFFARAYGLRGVQRQRMISEVVEFTGLGTFRDKVLAAISKGMKQRVSLARAILHDPEILILDEPAAGLDPRARIELRELIKALSAQGKAILISSHILSELAEIVSSAVIIERGHVLFAGPLDVVMQGGMDRMEVVVRPLSRIEDLHRTLLQTPQVEEVALQGRELHFAYLGNEEACCHLLRDLITQGFLIVEYHLKRQRLEDVFMRLTTGETQ